MKFIVYGLREIGTEEFRYVGLTTGSLKERLSNHRCSSDGTDRSVWIASVDRRIEAVALERTSNKNAEGRWIKRLRKLGHRLTNVDSRAGQHPGYESKELTAFRMSEALKDRVQRYADGLTKKFGIPIKFGAAARSLIELGLDKRGIR